jgi:hypothetical protein
MTFLPVVGRELRVTSRRRTTYLARLGAAFVSIVIAGFWLPVFAAEFTISQGKLLFTIISSLAFIYCLVAGARVTSDCVSAEKREGTIGLLFLTDLRGYDVILGKLVSCSLNAFYGLLGIVPVLALALLLGGVTLSEVGRMSLLFVNTMFFSMAAGVLVSTLSRNDRRAMFGTMCLIVLVTGVPYGIGLGYTLARANAVSGPSTLFGVTAALTVSPAFAFQMFQSTSVSAGVRQVFYASILTTHILSWVLLALASWSVPRVCRERPAGRVRLRCQMLANRWSYGKEAQRRAFRTEALDRNAFYWLSARERAKQDYVWAFVGAMVLIWVWAGWALWGFIFAWEGSFWLLLMFFAFLKVWVTSEVCARLAEDRASGGFELLLSSPLQLREIAHGQALGLWRQFGKPGTVAIVLTLLLLMSALRAPHEDLSPWEVKLLFWTLILTFLADLLALRWVATWQAIVSAQIHRAMLATCARVLLLPTILFAVIYGVDVLLGQATQNEHSPGWGVAAALWLGLSLANDLFFGLRARWRFFHQFREVVTQRYSNSRPGWQPFVDALRPLRQRLARVWSPFPHQGQTSSMGWHWTRWVAGTFAVILLVSLTSFLLWKHSLRKSIEARLADVRRAGEPVTIRELEDWGPTLLEDENAGILFHKASLQFWTQPPGRRGPVPTVRMEWPGPTAALKPELHTNLVQYLGRNAASLHLLHAGAQLPKSRYPIYWLVANAEMAPWQSLARLRPASDLLAFEALVCIERGDTAGALDSIQTLLALGRAMAQDPFMAAQYNRIPFLNAAFRALERLLNQHALGEPELRLLDASLREATDATGPAVARSFSSARCFVLDELRSPGQAAWRGTTAPTGVARAVSDLVDFIAVASGSRDRQMLQVLAALDDTIMRARLVGVRDREAVAKFLPFELHAEGSQGRDLLVAAQEYWRNTLVSQVELVARLHLARTALAIERFRMAHDGQLPSAFGDLPAQAPKDALVDPFTARPLRYVRLTQGYLVYSVGRDLEDNGGVELPSTGARFARKYDLTFRVER